MDTAASSSVLFTDLKYEGLSRSSWTSVKKLTIIIGFVWKFISINLDITMKGIQNFIQKYKLMTKLHAIDWCHVQRCAARQRSKWRRNVIFFLKVGTVWRYELVIVISPLTICLIKPLHCLRIRAFWLIPILVHPSHVLAFQFRAKWKITRSKVTCVGLDTG